MTTRIERVEVHPVRIPLNHPYRDSTRVETHSRDVLVRMVTSDGAVGWGAGSPRSFPTGETQVGTVDVLETLLVPVVVGRSPFDLEAIHEAMTAAIPGHQAAKAAIDVALHDVVGRLLDRPVHDLLGGRVRDSMPALDILPLERPERMAEIAAGLAAGGTRAFKVKIDRDVAAGVARVAAVREAVPDAMIVVDANGAWTVRQAVDAIARLEPWDVQIAEQPVPGEDIEGLAEVTRRSRIRVGADESVRPEFVGRLLAARAADVVNVKLTREGGLLPARKVAGAAGLLGIEVIAGTVVNTGLIDAAAAHFFAATPEVRFNESGKAPLWHDEDVITGLRIEGGQVHVPEGPGLGVEVDEAAVRRFRPTD